MNSETLKIPGDLPFGSKPMGPRSLFTRPVEEEITRRYLAENETAEELAIAFAPIGRSKKPISPSTIRMIAYRTRDRLAKEKADAHTESRP